MTCSIEGCDKKIRFKAKQLCQMHYFRMMRNGSYELSLRSLIPRKTNAKGYVLIANKSHPLADSRGYVYEHRLIVYSIYGERLPPCELCGKRVDWQTCHIDHIDNSVDNNSPDNLRPLCRPCNTFRDYPAQHTISGRYSITYGGETKTPHEWARDPRVCVSGSGIRHRKRSGMTDEQALFAPKVTHKHKDAKTNPAYPVSGA